MVGDICHWVHILSSGYYFDLQIRPGCTILNRVVLVGNPQTKCHNFRFIAKLVENTRCQRVIVGNNGSRKYPMPTGDTSLNIGTF